MNISRKGIFTDGGIPCSLAAGIKTAVGQQATFASFKRLATRTAVQGECDRCGAAGIALGVFVDCSPRGDSGTVETKGFEEVSTSEVCVAGDIVTPAAAGQLKKIAGGTPTIAELTAGCWQVDEAVSDTVVVIQLDARL